MVIASAATVIGTRITVGGRNSAIAQTSAPPPTASGPTTPQRTEVRRRDFAVKLRLDGVVVRDAEHLLAVPAGTQLSPSVEPGTVVTKGQVVGRVGAPPDELRSATRAVEDAMFVLAAAREAMAADVQRANSAAAEQEAALAAAGTPSKVTPSPVSDLAVRDATFKLDRALADRERLQNLAADVAAPEQGTFGRRGDVAFVQPTGLSVVADVTPIQALRLQAGSMTGTAIVETIGGRSRVDCATAQLEPIGGDGGSDNPSAAAVGVGVVGSPNSAAPTDPAGDRIRCNLPATTATAVGVRSLLELHGAARSAVLTVPEIAVRYDDKTGEPMLTRVRAETAESVHVNLGPTDGVLRVVEGGVSEGDVVELPG